jgi:receptor expression-enhancing protein 5/6
MPIPSLPPAFVFPQLSKYPALQRAEARTGIPKAYGVLGGAGLFSVFIFFNLAAGFLTTLLGWALPAYFSLKALESPSQGDDTQWLTYWTVFGAFQIVEYFSDMILYW